MPGELTLRRIFYAIFMPRLLGCREDEGVMDFGFLALVVGFFAVTGWLMTALSRL